MDSNILQFNEEEEEEGEKIHEDTETSHKKIPPEGTFNKNLNSENLFDLNYYILQKKIGEGSFGKVYLIKEKSTGNIYAAKISNQRINQNSKETIINLSREVNIIARLNHPNVLQFIGYSSINFKRKPKPVIVTEFASNGSLDDLIQSERISNSNDTFNATLNQIKLFLNTGFKKSDLRCVKH